MTVNSSQLKQLETELKRSLLISEEDRVFWLQELPTLPQISVENLINALQPVNQKVDSYLDTALQNDPTQSYLKQLKADVAKIKQKAYHAEEKSESSAEQQSEEDLLNQLDQV